MNKTLSKDAKGIMSYKIKKVHSNKPLPSKKPYRPELKFFDKQFSRPKYKVGWFVDAGGTTCIVTATLAQNKYMCKSVYHINAHVEEYREPELRRVSRPELIAGDRCYVLDKTLRECTIIEIYGEHIYVVIDGRFNLRVNKNMVARMCSGVVGYV